MCFGALFSRRRHVCTNALTNQIAASTCSNTTITCVPPNAFKFGAKTVTTWYYVYSDIINKLSFLYSDSWATLPLLRLLSYPSSTQTAELDPSSTQTAELLFLYSDCWDTLPLLTLLSFPSSTQTAKLDPSSTQTAELQFLYSDCWAIPFLYSDCWATLPLLRLLSYPSSTHTAELPFLYSDCWLPHVTLTRNMHALLSAIDRAG